MSQKTDKCELCGFDGKLTIHHLIPQFTNHELKELYNTKDKLLSEPKFRKYVEWRMKHLDFKGSSKMSNRRKR